MGHIIGLRGVFGQGIAGRLDFVGDETLAAQSLGHWDLLSAIDSTFGILNELELSEKPAATELPEALSCIVL